MINIKLWGSFKIKKIILVILIIMAVGIISYNGFINKQNKKVKVISQKQTFTETSKDRIIESLKRKIQSLEEENKKLKNDNSILLGKLAQR